ncbi:MAG: FtsW/RodA/SpoVE family cell cycle protein, partial [Patescibacteria group bacterium]|nr:FtsW/RodA/SpoVE family cell cycle protein [Patescibacteria group bacterium]
MFLTLLFGPTIRGTRGWLVLEPFRFQPVELTKVALILVYANFFSRRHVLIANWLIIFKSFVLFLIPTFFVLLQPDLGSFLILFGIWFGFLLLSGLPPKRIMVTLLIFFILGILGWNYFLKDYQKDRILAIFYPNEKTLTVNYSVIQSKIAIGSGGWWGRGF